MPVLMQLWSSLKLNYTALLRLRRTIKSKKLDEINKPLHSSTNPEILVKI